MADVEIISMLIPAAASVSNIRAATPGLVCMPAPIRLTRAMPSSADTSSAPSSPISPCATDRAPSSCSRGTVKLMSVTPSLDTFCTIMSTLTSVSASARNRRPATPGLSATPETVIFASLASWVTAEIMACSMASSPVTLVPGIQLNADRTRSSTP